MAANEKQIAGDHYKKYGDLQPWDVVIKWNLGYLEGTALKYIARWRDKGGIDDIKKAIHFLEKLVEINSPAANTSPTYTGITSKPEGGVTAPVDLSNGKRFYDPLKTSQLTGNPNYPFYFAALEEWQRAVQAQKALDDYHARDI